jgi:hypothetical protein
MPDCAVIFAGTAGLSSTTKIDEVLIELGKYNQCTKLILASAIWFTRTAIV